jgi:hypothetical protein
MEYLQVIQLEEIFPTAEELAKKMLKDYGVCNLHGQPHKNFFQAILERKLAEAGEHHLMRNGTVKVCVYQDEEFLRNFVEEELLPELETEKALSIGIRDANEPERIRNWRVFWKDTVRIYKKRPLGRESIREYYYGKLLNPHCKTRRRGRPRKAS